jgi:hypothetical protein
MERSMPHSATTPTTLHLFSVLNYSCVRSDAKPGKRFCLAHVLFHKWRLNAGYHYNFHLAEFRHTASATRIAYLKQPEASSQGVSEPRYFIQCQLYGNPWRNGKIRA